jgi:hypothetical protein
VPRPKRATPASSRSGAPTLRTGAPSTAHGTRTIYDRVRAYRGTHPYEKALRKRKVWVEPLFAEAKDWHGMRRFRLRRLDKVNIEALLIASGQNVKRLLAFGGRRPKKQAQAAALRPPDTCSYESSRARGHRSSHSWRPTRAFFNTLDRFRYSNLTWVIHQTSGGHALGRFGRVASKDVPYDRCA